MKTSKRILCMLLAIVMTLSMGTVALADTTPTVPASRFTLDDGNSTTVYLGTPKQLAYTVQPSDYNGTITWTSSKTDIATVSATGLVTGLKAGTTVITAKAIGASGELKAECTVTVAADAVKEFCFTDNDADTYYLSVGDHVTVSTKATFLGRADDTDASNVSFYIDDTDVATVNSSGKVTAVAPGSAFLYAEYSYGGKVVKTASAEIVVSGDTITVAIDQKEGLTGSARYELGISETVKFTAEVEPSSLSSRLFWTTSAKDTVAVIDNSGSFTAKAASSSVNVTAYIDLNDNKAFDNGEPSDVISVKIIKKPIENVKLSNATLAINGEKQLTPAITPASASVDDYDLVWSSSDETVATVTDGLVKAKASGTTTVMLQLLDKETQNVAFVATCVITVQNATYNPSTVNAKVGTNASLGLASTIASQFKSKTGCSSNPTTITIDSITGTNATLIYTGSSTTASAATAKDYTYSAFGSLYLRPKTAGTYYVAYTATNGSYKMTGTITIKVTANTKNITIEIDNSEDDYLFTSDANSDELPAYEIIADTIGTSLAYITFGSIDSWNDEDVGSLYVSSTSNKTVEDYDYEYLNRSSGTYTIRKLCFTPNGDEGTFAINYTAYNSSDAVIATGTLSIIVGESSDGDVVVTLDDDEPYYFSDDTEEEEDSAYGLIYDFIEDETNLDGDEGYIEFVDFIDDEAGTLYYDDDEDYEVEEDERYDMDEVYDFYFVPEEAGTYEVEFEVFSSSSSNTVKASGILQIVVPGDGDVVVTLDDAKSYAFSDDTEEDDDSAYNMILDYIDDATDKTVSYVRFGTVSKGSDVGSLYAGNALNASKVTSLHKFYVSALSSTSSLYDVTFEPAKAGTFEIPFTAYTSSGVKAASGTLSLVVPGSAGSSIEEVGDVIVYLDSDADDYYFDDEDEEGNTAYDLIIEYVDKEFDIDLEYDDACLMFYEVDEDEAGTLYANDDEDDLDEDEEYHDTELDEFYFVVDGDGSYEAEFDVYLWDDDTDEYEYEDSFVLQIIVGDGSSTTTTSTNKTMTCYSNGYTFKTADFYTISDSDPIMSVKFAQPATGKLYVNYANGSGTAVTSSTKFYTTTSSNGSYRITALTYIPKAGASGDVTFDYVATTSKGKTVIGTVTMSVKSKTASSKFSDVTASHYGSWSANAIDFASSWGLVNGVTTTAPYKFEPEGNMKRCDLLLILYRAAGSPAVTGTITHTDVPSTAYYYKAAVWAVKNGITNGFLTSTTTFAPTTTVTREEFATMLYNYTKYRGVSVSNTGSLANYTDASSVSSYAKAAMTWAVSKGYITSMSTTSLVLGAKNLTERAQIATMLHRYLTY